MLAGPLAPLLRRGQRCLLAFGFVVLVVGLSGGSGARAEVSADGVSLAPLAAHETSESELPPSTQEKRSSGGSEAEIAAQLARIDVLVAQGELDAARALATRVAAVADELGHPELRAAALASQGRIELASGNYVLASSQLGRARGLAAAPIAGQPSAAALLAAIETDLATLAVARGESAAAIEHSRAAAGHARLANSAVLEARALSNLARVLEGDAEDSAAQKTALQAVAVVDRLPPTPDRVYLLINLATTLERIASRSPAADPPLFETALEIFRRAAAQAAASGDARAQSHAQGEFAEALLEAGRPRAALLENDRAVAAATRIDAPELSYRWQWLRGRALLALGDSAGAIASYRHAVALSPGLGRRGAVGYQHAQFSFARDVEPVHRELVALLLDQESPDPESKQALLREARALVEDSRATELDDYFRDECVEQMQSTQKSIDLTLHRTVVVYPIVLPDRLELLLTLPGGSLERHTSPISAGDLRRELDVFGKLVRKRTSREYLRTAQSLYRTIIGPIESTLRKVEPETLVFVPDGPLRGVPMAALHDGERFLVERYATATTPGILLTDPAPIDRAQLQALFAGLSKSVRDYSALHFVPEELMRAREVVGGEILLDDRFKVASINAIIEQRALNLVHIATHGKFMEDPAESFVLTWDGPLELNQLGAELSRFRFRQAPLDILVLSACETAVGSERATLGLAGMAIRAGARSVMGTYWLVNDEATARLITAFYRQIARGGVSRAVALQRAQLELVGSARHHHPGYWAPFVMIGSWL
ncbi:MAG: CHAT domain-containing protein [bacterium]|nr:CHAT domain-containing protein [bacterium]